MAHTKFLFILSTACGLASCATPTNDPSNAPTNDRVPSSVDAASQEILSEILQKRFETSQLRLVIENHRISNATRPPDQRHNVNSAAIQRAKREVQAMTAQLQSLEEEIQSLTLQLGNRLESGPSTNQRLIFKGVNPYFKTEELVIDSPSLLEPNKFTRSEFIFENMGQKNYALELSSALFKPKVSRASGEGIANVRRHSEHIEAQLDCDGEVLLSKSETKPKGARGNKHNFILYDQLRSYSRHYIFFSNTTQKCTLTAFNKRSGSQHIVELRRNNSSPAAALAERNEACVLRQPNSQMNSSEALMRSIEFDNFSCPLHFDKAELFPDPLDALNAKIEMLTGSRVSKQALSQGDPYLPLDFSKAPQLDAIYISALVFRADFSGVLMSRMLEFHAKRGTEVKLFISQPVSLKKDKAFLERFPKQYPNFKIQFFKYPSSWSRGLSDVIQGLHRVNHIKALVTLSKEHDEHNQVMIGGRNYHDGFIFKEKPNHSKYPFMVNYYEDESFVHWVDLEMRIQSRPLAEHLGMQILGVWNRDQFTAAFHTPFVQVPTTSNNESNHESDISSSSPQIRSFLSGPYRDGQALEKFFVKMIDSARKKIVTVSPYLRLTDKIMNAMQRAVERGVKISIYTRIDLSGDTAATLMSDVNKGTINKLRKSVDIYQWTETGSILHTKTMLIDDDITFLGGVNLNKRSFIHDWENGMLVKDKKFNADIAEIIKTYRAGSKPVSEEQKIRWWTGLIINMLDDKL